jgi:hypothetical protein
MKQEKDNKRVQWVKFTYIGKETRAITKAFKNTYVKITFFTNNTIGKLLATKHHPTKCKYDKCGIYQIYAPHAIKNISDKLKDLSKSNSTSTLGI